MQKQNHPQFHRKGSFRTAEALVIDMEKIYTIPVNEAFESNDGCPFCRLHETLEKNELDIIMGAAMMEPDIRIKTNEKGFCAHHFDLMLKMGNRLSLALMLESHLAEVTKGLSGGSLFTDKASKASSFLEKLNSSCYLCDRIEYHFEKMAETACLLWDSEEAFKKKFDSQAVLCLPHYKLLLDKSKTFINKKNRSEFYSAASKIALHYLESLNEDVSWFCKKFDYRYDKEPWGNAKDAPERAIKFLGN